METRKIQEVGGGTFTVSLPREWAQAEGIGQGDVVDLHTHIDGVLVVETRDRETEPTGGITIKLQDTVAEQIRVALWAAYTAGYSEITLTAQDMLTRSQRRVANEVANVLAGATVTTTAEQEIVIDVLLDPDEISVRQLVRQLSFVALSVHQTAMAAVTDPRSELDLSDRDDQADRLFAMTERSFMRALARLSEVDSLGVTRPKLFELWSVARNLERVADHAERISTIVRELDDLPDEDNVAPLLHLAEHVQVIVEYAVEGIVDNSGTDPLCEALKLRTRVRKEAAELARQLFADEQADYRLARILDSVLRTGEHGGNIAERGLQQEIRSGKSTVLACSATAVKQPHNVFRRSTSEDG